MGYARLAVSQELVQMVFATGYHTAELFTVNSGVIPGSRLVESRMMLDGGSGVVGARVLVLTFEHAEYPGTLELPTVLDVTVTASSPEGGPVPGSGAMGRWIREQLERDLGPDALAALDDAGTREQSRAERHLLLLTPGRTADLIERKRAGHLTSLEALALAVLSGGGAEGAPVMSLIDAAQEEFAHGAYRVPVRVVADKAKARVVVTMPADATQVMWDEARRGFRDWVHGDKHVATVPAGTKVEVYEMGDGGDNAVVIRDATDPGCDQNGPNGLVPQGG